MGIGRDRLTCMTSPCPSVWQGAAVVAIAEGTLTADDLVPMRDVVSGGVTPPADRPLVFKSVGMFWQDLVVAKAVIPSG
jgi:ornithine cyclodeaminase/alanine dehydrogenase-like protein (mu-crystallin family)